MQVSGSPAMQAYFTGYSWYKTLEVASSVVELGAAVIATGYLSMYVRPEGQPSFVHVILKILIGSNCLIMVLLVWQSFDPVLATGNGWLFDHQEALFLMASANFGRQVGYWLFTYELSKVSQLMPQILNKDFSGRDPMLNFQKKRTMTNLRGANIFMVIFLGVVAIVHVLSQHVLGMVATLLPLAILVLTQA